MTDARFDAPRRNFSPWYAWMTRLAATERPPPPPLDGDDWRARFDAWRAHTTVMLEQLLGPVPGSVPLDVEVTERHEDIGYRRERVVFDTEPAMSVPAYLLIPNGRDTPGSAVLAIHGHGPGKSQACGLDDELPPGTDYARQLARRGHVVLAPDLRCFGERADWNPPDHYGCDTNLVHAVMTGVSPLRQNVWDMQRALDVLAGHPLVDPTRLAVAGLSYGGTLALFLAAHDERVAAAVVSGYLSSWAVSHRMPWNMCGSQVLWGMLGVIEHLDVAALIAPRPLLVETGVEDDLFPLDDAVATVADLRRVYERFGAGERLEHDVFEGGHRWHGERAYPFLERWLGPPPS